jgi:hypothetical protein
LTAAAGFFAGCAAGFLVSGSLSELESSELESSELPELLLSATFLVSCLTFGPCLAAGFVSCFATGFFCSGSLSELLSSELESSEPEESLDLAAGVFAGCLAGMEVFFGAWNSFLATLSSSELSLSLSSSELELASFVALGGCALAGGAAVFLEA